MRLLAVLLLVIPISLFSQKVEHETFEKIMRMPKIAIDPQTVKVDTLPRSPSRIKNLLSYQAAASLANFMLTENRDTALKLSLTCPNLIFLEAGTLIIYWDGDVNYFQGTFVEDDKHIMVKVVASCSRVYTIQQPF